MDDFSRPMMLGSLLLGMYFLDWVERFAIELSGKPEPAPSPLDSWHARNRDLFGVLICIVCIVIMLWDCKTAVGEHRDEPITRIQALSLVLTVTAIAASFAIVRRNLLRWTKRNRERKRIQNAIPHPAA